MSRRNAMRLGALTAAVPSALTVTGTATAAPPARTPTAWVVRPFGNHQVSLAPSLFAANRDRIAEFLRGYPADRMLAVFRANAGLDTRGANPPGGWETATGNLRGHYAGHYLSALALAYAGSGDTFYRDKLDYLVGALGECQDALNEQVGQPAPPTPPVSRAPGRFGNAVRLSGTGQYVALPTGIVSGLADFTVALWVNPAATTTWSRIFDFGTGTTRYMFLVASAGSAPRFAITTNGVGAEQRINGTAALPTNQWTHVAVTLRGNTGTLYVNGTPVAANDAMTSTPASLGATDRNWIGRSQFGDPFLNAAVDDLQIHDHALTAAEVRTLAGGQLGAGNVASYRFDESTGDGAGDSSGNGRDATLVAEPTGAPGPSHRGYLAAYPETQFILLERFATYPSIWAPWYTCHMIMRGLLDAYQLAGNQQALDIVLDMADWAHSRLAHLPRPQLDRMWRLYIAGEYNAMAAVLAELHALTGNPAHLETARCFINTYLFEAATRNEDILDGLHANQHIPQFLGYLAIFEQTGEREFYDAVANFWDMVVPHRIYTDGGMAGTGELFGARDVIAATIQETNAETCPCYNMLKLSRNLFFHDPDPKYMQYYERALYGQILASRQHARSGTNPLLTYFVPMSPGTRRSYGNLGTCCGGTGLESHVKYQDSIYFQSADGDTLYVNLYLASTLDWTERGFTVEQTTDHPTDPTGTTTITVNGTGQLDIKLRVPYWLTGGFTVTLNGVRQKVDASTGDYVTLRRDWRPGDRIVLTMPFTLRAERALDDPAKQSLAYGPVPLVTRAAETTYREFSFYRDMDLRGDLSRAVVPGPEPMTFSTHGYPVTPFYLADTAPYHAYFTRHEPRVVFGAVDSGVPNLARADGRTFLDQVWANAPFPTGDRFLRTVDRAGTQWRNLGLFTPEQHQAVLAAAEAAHLER
ncbi:MAG TPA: beta-L-arabinofuranosidase domain-containing protein [Actinophytocola sp.]|uniref:beta-L-arabinofuranosidase domain-containing protein n=1 Tax=Actinophytocola sp. TaxID=1872138 RepID=UPI002DBD87B1|nr:beta-L-arabinofuranosidase domain-containing protein [Actinophytocola sp.]HEU5470185.1 beta-L-arabinofuranosidase domain-containing protein [Actinophytocola sp.]